MNKSRLVYKIILGILLVGGTVSTVISFINHLYWIALATLVLTGMGEFILVHNMKKGKEEDSEKQERIKKIAKVTWGIWLFLGVLCLVLVLIPQTKIVGFVLCCVLSIVFSISYVPIHSELYKKTKRYAILYLGFALFFLGLTFLGYCMLNAEEFLSIMNNKTLMVFFPALILLKGAVDGLFAFCVPVVF